MTTSQTKPLSVDPAPVRRTHPYGLQALIMVSSSLISGALALAIAPPFATQAMFIGFVCSAAVSAIVDRIVHRYRLLIHEKNRELRARNLDLEALNELLSEGNAELAAFAHTVAHDLKGPLTGLLAEADLLELSIPDSEGASEARDLSRRVGRDCQRMAEIIDELLLLSSVRQEAITQEPLDMPQLVEQAKHRLGFMTEEHGAVIHGPDHWPQALGHPAWVRQIWVNYLSNAIKYGGKPPIIELGAMRTGKQVRFWVADNGEGLGTKDQARIFDEFYRAPGGMAHAAGHGLGLWIVGRIAKRLGGSVNVESEVGKGSRFIFTLPAAPEEGVRSGSLTGS